MIRESTRRRRRSRSISPGRSKRLRSRSRDRRGRDVAPRDPARSYDLVERRQDRGSRSRIEERGDRRGRDRDLDRRVNSLNQPASLGPHAASGNGASGTTRGRGRERNIAPRRELVSSHSDFRSNALRNGGGDDRMWEKHVGRSRPGDGVSGADYSMTRASEYGSHTYGNISSRNAPDAPGRADRDRDRERDIQYRDRDRIRDRERDKERLLLREREDRAHAREARAAADLRAAEAIRRDSARIRDETSIRLRSNGAGLGERGGGSGGFATSSLLDRPLRARPRERTRERGHIRVKGQYKSKEEVNSLFVKVIKQMGMENVSFPVSASLINDRMKKMSGDDYNVTNSEYLRFSNVLRHFEAEEVVGTLKARDSLQVMWTKYSSSKHPVDRRRIDSRRDRSIDRGRRAASSVQIYFCGANEAGREAPGSSGPYAEIIALLQARGEVLGAHVQQKDGKVATEDSVPVLAEEKEPGAVLSEPHEKADGEGWKATETTGKDGDGKTDGQREVGEVDDEATEDEENAVGNKEAGEMVKDEHADVPESKGARMFDMEAYRTEMGWLSAARGLVAEITTPSTDLGFKIGFMGYQRHRPCLCLLHMPEVPSDPNLFQVMKGDRAVDVREYTKQSDLPGIINDWFDKNFGRRRSRSRDRGERRSRIDRRNDVVATDERGKEKEDVGAGGAESALGADAEAERHGTTWRGEVAERENADSLQGDGGEGEEDPTSVDDAAAVGLYHDDYEEIEDATGDHTSTEVGLENRPMDVEDGDSGGASGYRSGEEDNAVPSDVPQTEATGDEDQASYLNHESDAENVDGTGPEEKAGTS